ncbi:hypothetical protein Bca52824_074449 [Brassica carinata]|uniref:Uncharacterized protein n=1 Tax=Brassica carinata TaxID=52824 RepID=A0A8X7PPC0_BRACI|nr:hypothetical protein Bca52824_074449 [Brassica carinata]
MLERKKGRTLLGKRKALGTIETRRTKKSRKMEGTLERHSLLQFGQLSKLSFDNLPPSSAADSSELRNELGSVGADGDWGEKEFILSQDFFW